MARRARVMRRFVFLATLVLVIGVAFYFWPRAERGPASFGAGTAGRSGSATSAAPRAGSAPGAAPPTAVTSSGAKATRPGATAAWSEADFPIAAPLNAPDSTIARDLDAVRLLFDAWQSNFPREGNPVGENADITAALMGDNRLQLVLVPPGHRAVNERGELCDRWGTPFRFHQISGTQMEIRSAGPDRKFATEDDAVWSPP